MLISDVKHRQSLFCMHSSGALWFSEQTIEGWYMVLILANAYSYARDLEGNRLILPSRSMCELVLATFWASFEVMPWYLLRIDAKMVPEGSF
jgi:hypothetical protein